MRKSFLIVLLLLPIVALSSQNHIQFRAIQEAPNFLKKLEYNQGKMSSDRKYLTIQSETEGFAGEYAVDSYYTDGNFTAKKEVVYQSGSGCEEGMSAAFMIQGKVDEAGVLDANEIEITVAYTINHDTCHSKAKTQLIQYLPFLAGN